MQTPPSLASPGAAELRLGRSVNIAAAAYVVLFVAARFVSPDPVRGAFVLGPVLVVASLPVLRWVARRLDSPWFLSLATTALIVKLMAGLLRYLVSFVVYDGSADAKGYDQWGRLLGPQLRNGDFSQFDGIPTGTDFIRLLTGLVYAPAGSDLVAAHLVFAWVSFWGLVLAVLAFHAGVPGGRDRRYALLVLFLPSLVFWPSAVGKEAWMTLGVGLTMYGVAHVLNTGPRGLVPLALGIMAASLVRPHVAVLLLGGAGAALIAARSRSTSLVLKLVKVVGILLLAVLASVVVQQASEFLGVEEISAEALREELTTRSLNTATGGSEFGGAAVASPADVPMAVLTVLFRPFAWEANGALPLLTALEGMLLLFLVWRERRQLFRVPLMIRSHPYVTFSIVYVLLYSVVFAGFSNFGILARQRSLVVPAFLVLLALPIRRGAHSGVDHGRFDGRSTPTAPTRG